MFRDTGAGMIDHGQHAYFQRTLLYNFDVEGHKLKTEHMKWLDSHVVPVLRHAGYVYIRAMTSRSGSDAYNQALSEKRATALVDYLSQKLQRDIRTFPGKIIAVGESQSQGGSQEDSRHRAVEIFLWRNGSPPPQPPGIPKYEPRIVQISYVPKHEMRLPSENPYETGEAGAMLGEFVREAVAGAQVASKQTELVKAHYVVTRIHVTEEHNYQPLGHVTSTGDIKRSKSVSFEWGLYTPSIEVTTTIIVIDRAGKKTESVRQESVRRERAGHLVPLNP